MVCYSADQYCAKLAGLLPDDPWVAALADQAYCFSDEVLTLFRPTWAIQDLEERIRKRQEIVAGPLKEKLNMLQDKILDAAPGDFVAGDRVTHGDLAIFVLASLLSSGIMDGVPKDILKDYPKVAAFRQKIANLDKVKAYYAKVTDDSREGFKP
eukprot:jgi/Chrzof1/13372/Cz07g30170.t1